MTSSIPSPARVSVTHVAPGVDTPAQTGLQLAPLASAIARSHAAPTTPEPAGRYLGGLLPDRSDPATGSRRLRLWDLPRATLCPVIGVCLPLVLLRRVLTKLMTGPAATDDYTVHATAIGECSLRSPVAEALQRELDQRHAVSLRRATQAKTTSAVLGLWAEALRSGEVAGMLWATLTHPRCDSELRERICRDVHMLQHQLGANERADVQQLARVTQEHAELGRELALVRKRNSAALSERDSQLNALTSELARLQVELVGKEALNAALRQDLAALEGAAGLLKTVNDLTHRNHVLQQRVDGLERQLDTAAGQAHQDRGRNVAADPAVPTVLSALVELPEDEVADPVNELRDKSILCVGGRTASVPVYRRLIEVTGGRFAHHDGGEKQTSAQLEASLAAADLVICQTGCVSHEAYWRVKDHCKRTGKRCVFIDNPSVSSLARSLRAVAAG